MRSILHAQFKLHLPHVVHATGRSSPNLFSSNQQRTLLAQSWEGSFVVPWPFELYPPHRRSLHMLLIVGKLCQLLQNQHITSRTVKLHNVLTHFFVVVWWHTLVCLSKDKQNKSNNSWSARNHAIKLLEMMYCTVHMTPDISMHRADYSKIHTLQHTQSLLLSSLQNQSSYSLSVRVNHT